MTVCGFGTLLLIGLGMAIMEPFWSSWRSYTSITAEELFFRLRRRAHKVGDSPYKREPGRRI